DSGVRAAKDYGYDCSLVHDACATCDQVFGGEKIPAESVHRSFMAALNGTFAKIISTDDFKNNF
nr:isochorismatase family protein [Spirochaetota bacterium]